MGLSTSNLKAIVSLCFLLFAGLGSALRFDLAAQHHSNERCIRNFVTGGQLVVVTAIVSGSKGDGQVVNMHVRLSFLNRRDGSGLTVMEWDK
jgi:hypothetical protein